MTLRSSDLQSDRDLDSLRNSCNVLIRGLHFHVTTVEYFEINLVINAISAQSDIANRYSAKIDQPNLLIFGPYWLKTLFFNK